MPFQLKTIFMISLLSLLCSACITLEMTEKKQTRYLAERGQKADFARYKPDSTRKTQIHYTQTGNSASEFLIVFVHGSPGSSSNFIDFLGDSVLVAKALLISADRPGFGGSKPRGKAMPPLQEQASALKPILEKYRDKKIILVGHSWGGPLIARMAMDYGELIHGLVFVAASVDPALEPSTWYRPILHFPLFRWMLPAWMRASNRELMFAVRELEAMKPLWEKIKQPCHIIQGDKDILVPKENADFAKKMLVNAPVTMLLEKEMNHFVPWSHPHLIKQALLEQLGK